MYSSTLGDLLLTVANSPFCFWPRSRLGLLMSLAIIVLQFFISVPSASSQCASCTGTAFEEFKLMRQEQILKELLKKLDLNAKPNVTVDYNNLPPIGRNNPRIQALIEQTLRTTHRRSAQSWRRMTEEEPEYFPMLYETEQEPAPQTTYIIAKSMPKWFGQIGALFKFSASLRNKFVHSAKLNIPIRLPPVPAAIRLNVFRRFANGSLSPAILSRLLQLEPSPVDSLVEQIELPLEDELVAQWIQTRSTFEPVGEDEDEERFQMDEMAGGRVPPNMIALYVEALFDDENLVQHPSAEAGEKAMFMELETSTMKSGRSRRNLNICRAGQNTTQKCCLYDLVIDFEKIGWSFVIAPKRYNAFICSGECTGIGHGAGIMTRQQAASAAKIDHYQCCHPKEYAGITILFVKEDNELMAREVPNMVAKECGCT